MASQSPVQANSAAAVPPLSAEEMEQARVDRQNHSPLVFQDERRGSLHSDPDSSTGEDDHEQEEEAAENPADDGISFEVHSVVSGGNQRAQSTEQGSSMRKESMSSKSVGSDDDEEDSPDMLQVDFDFCDTREEDFHGIKQILGKSAWTACNLSDIADLTVKQRGVGTCVKIDDGQGVAYAVISAFSIPDLWADRKCIRDMCNFLVKACGDAAKKATLQNLFNRDSLAKNSLGLVLNERFVNMPHELAPAIFQSLLDDVAWARKELGSQNEREMFNFQQVLFVTRCFVDHVSTPTGSRPKKRRKKSSKKSKQAHKDVRDNDRQLIYYMKFEDEIIHDMSTFSFSFPASKLGDRLKHPPHSDSGFGEDSYLVMLIEYTALASCVSKMNAVLTTGAGGC